MNKHRHSRNIWIAFVLPLLANTLLERTASAVEPPAGDNCSTAPTWTVRTVTGTAIEAGESVPADINGDGFMDVVGAAFGVEQVTWWENVDGTGTNWIGHPIGGNFGGAIHLAVGDLDQDGDMDVVVVVKEENDLIAYLNVNGDGLTWTAVTVASFFQDPVSVTIADIDGNGAMDIVAVAISGGVAWWRNHFGNGMVWIKTPVDETFTWAFGVSVADIDGDTHADIVASSSQSHEVSWWENADDVGGIWIRHLIKSGVPGARPVFAADMDHDDDIDVVVSAFGSWDLFWYENSNADGLTWTTHTLDLDFDAWSLFVTDLNGDGANDILGAGRNDDSVSWWDNVNGDGSIFVRNEIDYSFFGTTSISAADFDGDNDLDILASSNSCNKYVWYEQPGSPPIICPLDTNGDDIVNVIDLLNLLANWGPCPGACPEDNDDSGIVTVIDLLNLLAGWGTCSI